MTKSAPVKPLSERIADHFTLKKTSAPARNRAAFMVLREDIKQALNEGWKSKNIWETLFDEGKITFSYPTFHSYVTKLIQDEKPTQTHDILSKPEEKNPVTTNQSLPGFTYNPIPNVEELI